MRPATSKELTAVTLRNAAPGDVLRDKSVPGLHVRVFAGGSAYYLYYRTRARQARRPKLGDTNVLSLAAARGLARDTLSQVAKGIDPELVKRQLESEKSITDLFEKAYKEYWTARGSETSSWRKEVDRLWTRKIKPRFGAMRVKEPTLADIHDWHGKGSKAPISANRALAVLSKMLNLAETYGWRELNSNPCTRIARHPERKRKRFASNDELKQIGPLLDYYAPTYPAAVAFLYLLIFTGSRPSAIERARHDQLRVLEIARDGIVCHVGVLRFQGKTGEEEVVLPPPAMACLDRVRKQDATGSDLLLGIGMPRKLWYKIRKKAGCEDLWMRDLRRTFATQGMSIGIGMSAIGEILNHKSVQTTKIYALLPEGNRQETAGRIAGRMEQLLKPG